MNIEQIKAKVAEWDKLSSDELSWLAQEMFQVVKELLARVEMLEAKNDK